MSLATRCTACGTVFRVVQDQLRVSEGWVRCGRCAAVFNAIENLVDMPLPNDVATGGGPTMPEPAGALAGDRGEPGGGYDASTATLHERAEQQGWDASGAEDIRDSDGDGDNSASDSAEQRPAEPLSPRPSAQAVPAADAVPDWNDTDIVVDPDDRPAAYRAGRQQAAADARERAEDDDDSDPGDDDERIEPDARSGPGAGELADSSAARHRAAPTNARGDSAEADQSAVPVSKAARVARAAKVARAEDQPTTTALPSFLRQANRAERWRQPRVRVALGAAAVLGLLGLAAQVAHSYRDLVAARWPATAPVLNSACAALGCSVEPPRLIDALVVDSSGLLRVERSALYRLTVGLRNQGAFAVAVPALDISLTDTQGRLISRRVLRATDLGQTAGAVSPGRELLLQATLQAQGDSPGQAVAGYTIELFYP